MSSQLTAAIIEDEAVVAEDIRAMLTGMGYDVVGIAGRESEALALVRETRPSVVLMDIHLKNGGDGVRLADALTRELDVPVVFATAFSDANTLARAAATHPFGFVVKPFHERELAAALSMAVYRHAADRRLRQMERWLSLTLGSIGDAVLSADVAGRVTYLNAAAEVLTGWSREEAIGRRLDEVFDVRADGAAASASAIIEQVLRTGVVFHLTQDYDLINRRGVRVPIDDSIAPLRRDDGEVEGVVVIFRDRSAAKRAQLERMALEQRMQDAQRLESLGVLAGGIAHDFNNLLTVILGNASMGETMVPAGSEIGDLLAEISSASRRAAAIAQQMLAYAGRAPRRLTTINLSAFVSEAIPLLRTAVHKRVALTFDLHPAPAVLIADTGQLQQVLMNLVINASDAIGERGGAVVVRTRVRELDAEALSGFEVSSTARPGRFVVLEVSDDGPGMDAVTQSRIFDPFFTTKALGRGLGLSAVLGIVRDHEGALQLTSALGRGTVFAVAFPYAHGQPTAPAAAPPTRALSGAVIIVDDEDGVRSVMALALRRAGLDVTTAGSLAEVREILIRPDWRCDLAVLDITMLDASGKDVAVALRARFPNLPIVYVSGYDESDVLGPLADDSRRTFLQKPFPPAELIARVGALLDATQSRSSR